MNRLRIMMANFGLGGRSGTETHLRDHALAFLRRGHEVMVYAPVAGPLAAEIARAGGEVRAKLGDFSRAPDIIHGNHHLQLAETLLHFRETPAVSMCHGVTGWEARIPRFPRVQFNLAVDWNCREHVSRETGLGLADIPVVPNTVDTDLFLPRDSLPAKPRRALIFGTVVRGRRSYLHVVKTACAQSGLTVDVIGEGAGAITGRPESVLPQYDIVVAKARCALEALAVGCHVILCSYPGLGPTITAENFEKLYDWNLGARLLTERVALEAIRQRIQAYDPARTLALREVVRSACSVKRSADQLLDIYARAIARFQEKPRPTAAEELAAVGRYFSMLEQELHHLDSRIFMAHYRGLPHGLMRHLRTRPRLRRFIKRVLHLIGRN